MRRRCPAQTIALVLALTGPDCLSKPYSAAQLRDRVARWTVARRAAGGDPAAIGAAAAG
jgi:hypothetical protein